MKLQQLKQKNPAELISEAEKLGIKIKHFKKTRNTFRYTKSLQKK